MSKGIQGLSFNVVRTSDDKLLLEYQAIDPINRQPQKFVTVHADFDGVAQEMRRILAQAGVT